MDPTIIRLSESAGHKIFRGHLDVNIIGMRTASRVAGAFDDRIHLCYQNEAGEWVENRWPATTDPGVYWLEHPMRVEGTAILAPGQYRGAYQLGKHRGYEALVQTGDEVSVYRDNNRDQTLDMETETLTSGHFGINIHRASSSNESIRVHKWSAGCQVFADPEDFRMFLGLVKKSMARYGDRVSYTLLAE